MRLIHFDDFSRGGEEGDELGDFRFGQSEALDESRVVENSLNFFQHGTLDNNPMSSVKKLQKECSRWSDCPRICPDQDS